MRASESTTVFGHSLWPQTSRLTQFHPEPRSDERPAVQTPDTDKPFFAKRTELTRVEPTEISFGPFRLLPTQFLLLEGDKPVHLGSRALEITMQELVSKKLPS